MTYWSRIFLISSGVGSLSPPFPLASSWISSRMMSLQRSTHSSQIKTEGPAISLRTSCWLLPQKEQYNSLPLSSPCSLLRSVIKSLRLTIPVLKMLAFGRLFKPFTSQFPLPHLVGSRAIAVPQEMRHEPIAHEKADSGRGFCYHAI